MSSPDWPVTLPRRAPSARAALQLTVTSSRLVVYVLCAMLALVTAHWAGKDMQWDTLDYHLYAGFSALHDRFGLDYFAAAPQSYLNPYVYVPFYLLAVSGLSALAVAAILALLQSAILWLTYELAFAAGPRDRPRMRVAIGVFAVLFAFVNPVLIQQFGSSFADITTAEVVLSGWLIVVSAVRAHCAWRVAVAGFLLGIASALKLTNSLDAISAAVVPLLVPASWPKRFSFAALFGLCVGLGFAIVAAPWSIQLERHFGNPFFPLVNGLFRSPEFTTAPVTDFRFIPSSFAAALWRPFAIAAPTRLVHLETPAPDLRYALLAALGMLLVVVRMVSRWRRGRAPATAPRRSVESRMLLALGCAFLINWVMWLSVSGNGRYCLPMACVAGILIVNLVFRLLGGWPRLCVCAMLLILGAQVYQVQAGTVFRPPLPWGREAWFDISMPEALASQDALYFSVGMQSNSFVVPYLAPGSGFVNLHGDYVLGPDGANGARLRKLIKRFSPHLRVLVTDTRVDADRGTDVPHLDNIDDALEPFGYRVDAGRCVRIVTPYAPTLQVVTVARQLPRLPLSKWYVRYLVSCQLVPDRVQQDSLVFKERAPNLVLDRMEDACPELLQPSRPVTSVAGSYAQGYTWARWYSNTDVLARVHDGRVTVRRLIGAGHEQDAGLELAWERAPLRVECGLNGSETFLRVLQPH